MIKPKNSFKLATRKFATRKGRNIFSSCTVALGIIIILVMLFASAGVKDLVTSLFKDNLSTHYLALTTQGQCVAGGATDCKNKFNLNDFKSQHSDTSFVNVWQSISSEFNYNLAIFAGKPITSSTQLHSLAITAVPDILISDFIAPNYSFNDNYQGAVPIIIPKNYLIDVEKIDANLTDQEKLNKSQEILNKYLGNTYLVGETINHGSSEVLKYEIGSKLKTKFIIVGFYPTSLIPDVETAAISSSIIIPSWAATIPEISDIYSKSKDVNVISEFDSNQSRNDFVKKNPLNFSSASDLSNSSYNTPILSRYEIFAGVIQALRGVVIFIGGILLLISTLFIFTTLNKIIDDSKKEIGVYRAFGALKNDIRQIYYIYALLISNLGFLIGLVIALAIGILLSLAFGNTVYYALANLGNNAVSSKPLFLFIGIPLDSLLILYIIVNILAILAASLPIRRAANLDPIQVLRDE